MQGRPPKAPKITRVCQQCGKQWQAYEHENRILYCSRDCFYASRIGRRRQLDPSEREERACLRCGKTFVIGGAGYRPRGAKYCSRVCSKNAYWQAIRRGEEPPPARATFEGQSHDVARQMSDNEQAWFAGLFDGEGCVGWPRRHVLHSVYLSVTNTNKRLIDKIVEVSGTGRVKPVARNNPRHSAAWVWACYGDNARSILRQILPWLIIKREAAEVALGIKQATEPPWTQRTRTTLAAEEERPE